MAIPSLSPIDPNAITRSIGDSNADTSEIKLRYRLDGSESQHFIHEIDRKVVSDSGVEIRGQDKEIDMPFIFDNATAERFARFRAEREYLYTQKVEVTVGFGGHELEKGDIIEINVPHIGLTGQNYEILSIDRSIGLRQKIIAIPFDWEVFSDQPVDLEIRNEPLTIVPDYTQTPPDPVSNLQITLSAVSDNGVISTTADLFWDAPLDNYGGVVISTKDSSDPNAVYKEALRLTGVLPDGPRRAQAQLRGLRPIASYDFLVETLNINGTIKSIGELRERVLLSINLVPPSNIIGTRISPTSVRWTWDANTEDDIVSYLIELRAGSNVESHQVRATETLEFIHTHDATDNDTVFEVRIRAINATGGVGDWSLWVDAPIATGWVVTSMNNSPAGFVANSLTLTDDERRRANRKVRFSWNPPPANASLVEISLSRNYTITVRSSRTVRRTIPGTPGTPGTPDRTVTTSEYVVATFSPYYVRVGIPAQTVRVVVRIHRYNGGPRNREVDYVYETITLNSRTRTAYTYKVVDWFGTRDGTGYGSIPLISGVETRYRGPSGTKRSIVKVERWERGGPRDGEVKYGYADQYYGTEYRRQIIVYFWRVKETVIPGTPGTPGTPPRTIITTVPTTSTRNFTRTVQLCIPATNTLWDYLYSTGSGFQYITARIRYIFSDDSVSDWTRTITHR